MAKGSVGDKVPEEKVIEEKVVEIKAEDLKVAEIKPQDEKNSNGNGKKHVHGIPNNYIR